MPIVTLQERSREIGRIRVGMSVAATTKSGKQIKRPVRLDTFRFTTNSEPVIRAVAAAYGGSPALWVDGSQTFHVITETARVDVIVPPGEPLTQWYELWTGGRCVRRCDGEQMVDRLGGTPAGPCECPSDVAERLEEAAAGRACKPTTRLGVILPDLPDIGIWRVETHGYNAAVELGSTVRLLAAASDRSIPLRAALRLETRHKVTQVGEKVQSTDFPVVVLEVEATLREVAAVAGPSGPWAQALPPAPPSAAAIGAGSAWETTRPTVAQQSKTIGSAQEFADALKAVAVGDLPALNDLLRLARAHPEWAEEYVDDEPPPAPMENCHTLMLREKARIGG